MLQKTTVKSILIIVTLSVVISPTRHITKIINQLMANSVYILEAEPSSSAKIPAQNFYFNFLFL